MKNNKNKIKFLNKVAKFYDVTDKKKEFDFYYKKFHFESIYENLSGTKILELGCSTGLSTKFLSDMNLDVTVLEGSELNIKNSKKNFKFNENIKFIEILWEDFKTDEKFSDILLVDSLQLLTNKNILLEKYKKMMDEDAVFHIISPNSNSLHRQVGKEMGIINSLTDQSEMDKLVSSHQNLNWENARELFIDLNFEIVKEIPILLKPLDNKSMLKLDEDQITSFFNIAKDYKSICSHMYFALKNV